MAAQFNDDDDLWKLAKSYVALCQSVNLLFSHALTMQTDYSMALWLATFTSVSVLKTLYLALFYLIITAHPAADCLTFIGSQYTDGFSLKLLL